MADTKKAHWLSRYPTISVVGLIALTVAVIAMIPSVYGTIKVNHNAHQTKDLVRENRTRIAEIAAQQKAIRMQVRAGQEAHQAICSLRTILQEDLRRRGNQSVTFAETHPEGLTLGGFHYSADELIKQGTALLYAARQLDDLRC